MAVAYNCYRMVGAYVGTYDEDEEMATLANGEVIRAKDNQYLLDIDQPKGYANNLDGADCVLVNKIEDIEHISYSGFANRKMVNCIVGGCLADAVNKADFIQRRLLLDYDYVQSILAEYEQMRDRFVSRNCLHELSMYDKLMTLFKKADEGCLIAIY